MAGLPRLGGFDSSSVQPARRVFKRLAVGWFVLVFLYSVCALRIMILEYQRRNKISKVLMGGGEVEQQDQPKKGDGGDGEEDSDGKELFTFMKLMSLVFASWWLFSKLSDETRRDEGHPVTRTHSHSYLCP